MTSPEIVGSAKIVGGAGPMQTAAILAAVARLVEEQLAAAGVPPERPEQEMWVLSGRPRPVQPPSTRSSPTAAGWSVGSSEDLES